VCALEACPNHASIFTKSFSCIFVEETAFTLSQYVTSTKTSAYIAKQWHRHSFSLNWPSTSRIHVHSQTEMEILSSSRCKICWNLNKCFSLFFKQATNCLVCWLVWRNEINYYAWLDFIHYLPYSLTASFHFTFFEPRRWLGFPYYVCHMFLYSLINEN